MNCPQVQTSFSLYLYGELEFAVEEELEQHLQGCSFCQLALSREKDWHTKLNGERRDVSLDLLAQCRRDLRTAMKTPERKKNRQAWQLFRFLGAFPFSGGQWSKQLAFASFFLLAGFSLSNWMNRVHFGSWLGAGDVAQMGFLNYPTRIREIQGASNNQVRIVIDRVQQQEIVGSISDEAVRRLLLTAVKDPADPGLQVDLVELLKGQDGADVRDALLYTVRHDDNAAVRLKALEGLRRFRDDRTTHETLRSVLQDDASPAVRSAAIDLLVPAKGPLTITPELASTLEEIARSDRDDDYLRARCLQVLRTVSSPPAY